MFKTSLRRANDKGCLPNFMGDGILGDIMTTMITKIHTFFSGQQVGSDAYGNRYYQSRGDKVKGKKRWVVYAEKGEDASAVSPSWHGWLHYMSDVPPKNKEEKLYSWQRDSSPNRTGSKEAFLPAGHVLKDGKRAKATGDYQAWKPK